MEKKTKNAKVSIQKLNLFAVKLKIMDFIRLPIDLLSLPIHWKKDFTSNPFSS